MLTDEEREKVLSVWDIQPNVGAEYGPSVLVAVRGASVRRLLPDEARELALRLWDVADEAEGFRASKTEPSPATSG